MILVQASVTGKKPLGSIHIFNDTSHPEHPHKGFYNVMICDGNGVDTEVFTGVEHDRGEDWLTLLEKCLAARSK